MKRAAIAAIILVVAGSGAWLAWRRGVRPAAVSGPTTPARPAQPRVVLQLRADLRKHIVVNQGASFRLEITLAAVHGTTLGATADGWDRRVSLALANGAPLPWSLDRAGPSTVIEDRAQSVVYDTSPQASSTIAPDRYELIATLAGEVGQPAVRSRPVVVELRAADPKLERARQASAAAYFIRHAKYAEARALAEALVAKAPEKSGPYVLLGRSLEGLADRKGAIDAYTRALRLMPRLYEEPGELVDRIGRLIVASRKPPSR